MSDRLKHNANGERFLRLVLNFIQQHDKEIEHEILVFSLNPTCCSYLNGVIKGDLRVSPAFSDNDLQDIASFVTSLISLKIESNSPRVLEKHKIIDLSIFRNLRILEINYCKPSLIQNLSHLSLNLIKLSVHNSIVAFSELLGVEDDGENPGPPSSSSSSPSIPSLSPPLGPPRSPSLENLNPQSWFNLRVLDVSHNFAPRIDSTVTQLTRVEKMDLSNNLLTKIENLQHCMYLSELNLSFNRLSTMAHVNEVVGSVRELKLCNNLLESAEGLDKLYALEFLDLSNNALGDLRSVRMLGALPLLSRLSLAGNPLVQLANYRVSVLALFEQRVILDGEVTTEEEKAQIDESRAEAVVKKKKIPKKRVAAIEEITANPEEDTRKQSVDDKDFKEILQIRQEMGEKWLLILNEMNKDSPELHHHNPHHTHTHHPHHPHPHPQPIAPPQATPTNGPLSPSLSSLSQLPHPSPPDHPPTTTHEPHPTTPPHESHPTSPPTVYNNNNNHNALDTLPSALSPALHSLSTSPSTTTPEHLTPATTPATTPHLAPHTEPPAHHPDTKSAAPTPITSPALSPTPSPAPKSQAPSPAPAPSPASKSSPAKPTSPDFVPIAPLGPVEPTSLDNIMFMLSAASTQPPKKSDKFKLDDSTEALPAETIHVVVIREDSSGTVERFLEIKQNKVLEIDINGNLVIEMDIKNIDDVKDVSRNTIEICNRFWSTTGGSTVSNVYHLKSHEDKQLIMDYLLPLLPKKFVQCVNCSTVFDARTMDKCAKCGGTFLVQYTPAATTSDDLTDETSLDSGVGPTSPASTKDLTQPVYDEDSYQEMVKDDVNFQTHLKIKVFLNANEETFVYMFRTPYIKANSSMESESIVFLVLSTKSIYFLKRDKPTDEFSVLLSQPLSRLRRVVVGLFHQLFRLEIDTNAIPSTSPVASSSFLFLPRCHYRTHKFVDTLMTTVRGSADTFDPPELTHTLKDTLYNINVCMMIPASDVQLYVMLHYKSKFHKGLLPRSLILSSERAFLCQEDYSKWPTAGVNHSQFEQSEINKKAKHERAKLGWRRAAGYSYKAQFEPQFTRDMRDVTGLQTSSSGPDLEVVILFEDELEGAKENKNKPREWTLVPANPLEQQRIVKMLSFLWKNLFRINLPIEPKA